MREFWKTIPGNMVLGLLFAAVVIVIGRAMDMAWNAAKPLVCN